MVALEPVTFRDIIDAIATLPIINFSENSSQLNSNKREMSCNKRLRLPRKRLSRIWLGIKE
ncbi:MULTISPECIES: hypothetical protein [unclassified Microcoleus]|uniref:hypothetical protein n=1 Tax=unclassified Microcoleus TaxID=2642155 RepID=UPI002FCF2404